MAQKQDRYEESDQAAMQWLLDHSAPGLPTKIAGALKLILDSSQHGEIMIVVRDGVITGHPKAHISIS